MSLVRQPAQERSRRTLERTLQATERLLRREPFEQITVERIVEEAGSSVGSFYARFGSKEGLLPYLYERYDRDLHQRVEAALQNEVANRRSLVGLVRRVVELHVGSYRQRRWLMRAIGFYARREPQPLAASLLRKRAELHRRIVHAFQPHFDSIAGPDPARRIELVLYFMAAVCRDKIVLAGPHAHATRITDKQLKEELTTLCLAYFGAKGQAAQAGRTKSKG